MACTIKSSDVASTAEGAKALDDIKNALEHMSPDKVEKFCLYMQGLSAGVKIARGDAAKNI